LTPTFDSKQDETDWGPIRIFDHLRKMDTGILPTVKPKADDLNGYVQLSRMTTGTKAISQLFVIISVRFETFPFLFSVRIATLVRIGVAYRSVE